MPHFEERLRGEQAIREMNSIVDPCQDQKPWNDSRGYYRCPKCNAVARDMWRHEDGSACEWKYTWDQLNDHGEIMRYSSGMCGPACGHEAHSMVCDRAAAPFATNYVLGVPSSIVGTVVTPQQRKCLRGEHEAVADGVLATKHPDKVWIVTEGKSTRVLYCRHCRCLFAERP